MSGLALHGEEHSGVTDKKQEPGPPGSLLEHQIHSAVMRENYCLFDSQEKKSIWGRESLTQLKQ